ncbi:ABC transporter permease subunit [Clostridium septicum]|uniref:ABC transporter permease n=1 Tax=Clostridium septicum TaxID=1504 RepID=A0A9N7PJ08_CLOSE|nr:ABC transporter permease [Clostridium septicum]AYE34226.1 ABC transporter permease [Clostridium septicum]QAS59631.1 ABC transporter permease [Clostridium septicum]UEC21140.1 ABC transporter permease subunit [Clostridium septicum]USS00812.1 ABC transporter permease subunit [Clostridium septicum]
MLFTLIKNEFIKLVKKAKTWIVFCLFCIFIGLTIFGAFKSDQNMRYNMSPEKQLEYVNEDLKYIDKEIADFKNMSEEDKIKNAQYILETESRKSEAEERKKEYENIITNGVPNDQWKKELDENIKYAEEAVKRWEEKEIDESNQTWYLQDKQRLEEYKYLKDNNIKPLYGWEFEAYGYMKTLMVFLALAVLVSGIAVFMSDIVSGECTPATLKFLLVQPITRGKVLLSKFITATLTTVTMIVGVELIGFGIVNLISPINTSIYPVTIGRLYKSQISKTTGIRELVSVAGSGEMVTNQELFVKAMLLQVLFIITACAVIFLISSVIKSSMVTMATTVVVSVFLTIGCVSLKPLKAIAHLIFLNYADTISVIVGSTPLMYGNVNMTMNNGIIVMIITSILSYVIGHLVFTRKDILI